ncbi:AAA family ATPase [Nocardia sp. alder85J]|uniref:AAA family ATPase n=1 Tax=Nocardia sp. alder85J TaxID=2862949 RepID=UPI001CD5E78B|nr:AAA family ATPase [Nocardia sp. alder85J]MCX4097768.1 AAA family ATPase [Nocardia sp. alder85J]
MLCVWLNGPFGSGKTSAAGELVAQRPRWRLFDPEFVGFMLRSQLTDVPVGDFQDYPSWRRLVPIVADEIAAATGDNLVIVQTVTNREYWAELADGIGGLGHTVRLVLLDADPAVLRRRISEDEVLHRAADWRLAHLPTFARAREKWVAEEADLVVDTTSLSPRATAARIADAIRDWAPDKPDGDPHDLS